MPFYKDLNVEKSIKKWHCVARSGKIHLTDKTLAWSGFLDNEMSSPVREVSLWNTRFNPKLLKLELLISKHPILWIFCIYFMTNGFYINMQKYIQNLDDGTILQFQKQRD